MSGPNQFSKINSGWLSDVKADPSQNMQRFYTLSVQPSLFGGQSLVRTWGRIGSNGRLRIDLYADTNAAVQALNALARAKRARGYIELT